MIYLYNRTHIHINNNLQQAGLMNIHDIICDQPAKVIGELEFFGDDLLPQMIEENSTKAQKGDEKNDVPLTSVERIINKIVAGISYLLMAVVIFIKFFYKENEEEPPQPSS